MSIIVMKFGGTSVADIDCIKNVANKVAAQYKKIKRLLLLYLQCQAQQTISLT